MKKNLQQRKKLLDLQGMTILELVTVIVIIGILAVMLMPVVSYMKERAEMTSCTGNLKGLHVASVSYITDAKHWPQVSTKNFGKPEYAQGWHDALKPYGIGPINWACPTAQRGMGSPDLSLPKNVRIDYHATPFDAEQQTPYKWPTQPWFIEAGNFHGEGPLIIFCNGNIKSLTQHLRDTGFKGK